MPRSRLYYFNGFNSAIIGDGSDSPKIVAVAAWARGAGLEFQPASINYRRAAEHRGELLAQIGAGQGQVVFAGSSMGGWFARIMQLSLAQANPETRPLALAINPAFDLVANGHLLLGPQQNFVTGEHYEWTEEHRRMMADLERSVDYDAPLPFFVYADENDEVIDCAASRERHASIAHFRAFPGGSHSFEHIEEALADFDSAVRGKLIR